MGGGSAGSSRMTRVKCEFCNYELDTTESGTHQWTAGWVKLRSGGGGHGVSLPVREPKWAHGQCVERRVKGWDSGQGDMFTKPPEPPRPPAPTNAAFNKSGMLIHVCNECGSDDAPYGYFVGIKNNELGFWYCKEHRPSSDAPF